ncbi:heme oxygenase [Haematobacter missouriensis]|nr:biliverdin-producing heme oxygenase [Haematobacter missouriensis]KFI33919.1 heme oxygenase [Haematobacter missouriensis]OWJ85914.1 hypothetical protein CDV52_01750 [Haematobacter missouriensis]
MTDMPRRWHLRTATHALHDVVDKTVGSVDSLAGYGDYLLALFRFRIAVETALQTISLPEGLRGWQPARVAPALLSDIRDLGLTPMAPLAGGPILDARRETAYGTLYVLEGATLGAQVLLRQAQTLGLTGEHGARHLVLQAGRIPQWREFLARLEAETDFDLGLAATASSACFALAKNAFGKGI